MVFFCESWYQCNLLQKGYASILEVPYRFNRLSVFCLSCRSEMTMKGGVRKSDFFPRKTRLMVWLHEFMSRRNPSSRSASSQKVEEKVCSSFSSCLTSRKALYGPSRYLKPISMGSDLHQVLKPKKKLALERPPVSHNAASKITHSTIASQYSSRVATTFNAHALCRRHKRNCLRIATRSWHNTVPRCVHDITCKSALSWNWGRSAVQCHELCMSLQSQDNKNGGLA